MVWGSHSLFKAIVSLQIEHDLDDLKALIKTSNREGIRLHPPALDNTEGQLRILAMNKFVQVLTSIDSQDGAQRIAKALVERRLVACAQILGPIKSTYWWEGKIEEAEEWLLTMKSRQELFPKIEEAICSLHPYKIPEILALPILAGNSLYLKWIAQVTQEIPSPQDPYP